MNIPDIADSLRADECVLLLGPRAATFEGECLQDLLAERFAQKSGESVPAPGELPNVARRFIEKHKNASDALESTGRLLREFYAEFQREKFPLYDLAAQLPFKYVLNCTPDQLFLEALKRADKQVNLFSYFHFNHAEFNLAENKKALDWEQEIAADSPLVYNLLGHYADPSSLVLTDADRLAFLDVVLQREKEATLPANIAYHFLRPPLGVLRKTYLFIGFDFNEWHLRLFMHLLRRTHKHLPKALTLQQAEQLPEPKQQFFTDNFNMMFLPDEPEKLLRDLQRELRTPAPAAPDAKMELLLLYHPDDEILRAELEKYLATLKYSGLVEVWHEAKILPGQTIEAEMQARLARARVILPILTANFLADERLYHQYLAPALERHRAGEAKLTPLLFSPCDWENTPLKDHNPFYPKPRGKAVSQKPDPAETLTHFAKELRDIIERMLNIKAPNAP